MVLHHLAADLGAARVQTLHSVLLANVQVGLQLVQGAEPAATLFLWKVENKKTRFRTVAPLLT